MKRLGRHEARAIDDAGKRGTRARTRGYWHAGLGPTGLGGGRAHGQRLLGATRVVDVKLVAFVVRSGRGGGAQQERTSRWQLRSAHPAGSIPSSGAHL